MDEATLGGSVQDRAAGPSLKRHEPLYLKYRPQALDQLVGQSAVLQTLTNAINHDRISHAYLFTGPRGTGKTSSARILAKSLNCKAGDKATVNPCLKCASCLEIKTGNSPAVLEIDAASNNSVDDARALIERAPLVAPGGRYKIYIIDECHMLTKEAFNALLKTIEDPPPNVVFVLATTEEHKVLPTIISRCQRLMFRLVTHEDLLVHLRNLANLENIEITDRAIDFIARRSGGGLRDAIGLLDQASLLSAPNKPVDIGDLLSLLGALHEDVLLEMSQHIGERSGHSLLTSAAKLLHEGREPAVVIQELARHFLNLAKASYLYDVPNRQEAASSLIVGSPNYIDGLWQQAPKYERSELSQIVEALDRLEQTCRRTTQPAMHLEIGLLALCHRQDMLLVRELADRVARLEAGATGGKSAASAPPVAARLSSAGPAPAQPTPSFTRSAQPTAPSVPEQAAPVREFAQSAKTPQTHSTPEPTTYQAPPAVIAVSAGVPDALPVVNRQEEKQVHEPIEEPLARTSEPAPEPLHPPVTTSDETEALQDSASAEEVDRIWSSALEQLHSRNIPAYSVAKDHAFLHSMTEKEIVLGVQNETFLKTLDNKLDHLKAACSAAVSKEIHVKLKLMVGPKPAVSSPKPAPAERPPAPVAQLPAAAPTRDDESSDNDDGYDEPGLKPRVKLDDFASAPKATAPESDPEIPESSTTIAEEQRSDENAPAPSGQRSVEERRGDPTILKEAYKLFEGPGSRQIG